MPRPGLLLRAVAAVTTLVAPTVLVAGTLSPVHASTADRMAAHGSHAAAAADPGGVPSTEDREDDTPLAMSIDQLSPGAIPRHGSLHISGTVTNEDTQTWTDIRVYPFIGGTPMTTSAQLAQAAASDPTELVGSRITSVGDDVGDLVPGQTVRFSITIPHDKLTYDDPEGQSHAITQPGVYWFGVHALGSNNQGRDNNADGRARTFLPLLPQAKNATPAKVALLLQLRRLVQLQPNGSVADVAAWTTDLTTGQLGRLVRFANGNVDVTWLVDPAVLDAVRRLAAGNPPRDLSPDPTTSPGGSPSPSPTPSPSATSSSTTPQDAATAAAKQAAQTWLAEFKQAITNHQVLALPYGDPDLSALATALPAAYQTAREQSDAVFKSLGITTTPVVAPLSGYLSPAALRLVGAKAQVILGSQAIADSTGAQVALGGNVIDLTSTPAAAGGPAPGDPLAPIALRQRLLAEASLRYNHPNSPLVVALPSTWTPPSDPSTFQAAFGQTWLDLSALSNVEPSTAPRTITARDVVYPASEALVQVSKGTLHQVRSLITAGETLSDVLPNHRGVSEQITAQALTSASYSARGGDDGAAMLALQNVRSLLGQVHIDPPTGVTLSSASGRFSVTIVNRLSQSVLVHLRAISDGNVTVTGPDSIRIDPGDTSSVLLSATAHTNGVHQITLELADSAGHPFGASVHFPVRASQVSGTIWLFVGVGVGLLFLAIAVRLVRRVRLNRRQAGVPTPTEAL